MSVKSKKKPAVKKNTAQSKTTSKPALKKPANKKVAASKSAKSSKVSKTEKSTKVAKVAKGKSGAANKALPGSNLSKVFQAAHAETKKLMVPANKKASTAKQAWMSSAKKLKAEQDNLSKLEQKHSAKPSAALNKQVASAKNKVKLATSAHSKAQSAHNDAAAKVSHYQNHLNKLNHLEKSHRDSSAAWDKQNTANKPAKDAAKPASRSSTKASSASSAKSAKPTAKPTAKQPAGTPEKANKTVNTNNTNKNKAKAGSNSAKTGLNDDRTWTKFDEDKNNLFSKVDSLAQYDSELDDSDNPWNKTGHNN